MLDINQIKEILPHRYPFLLVDKILEMEDEKITGLKNVSANEDFFNGHYPDHPIMPGVLIVEAMAQVAGVLMLDQQGDENSVPYFAGIDKARFRKPVVPGDQLIIKAEVLKLRGRIGKIAAEALVEDKVVAEAKLMFAIEQK